jgi:hypothetical protein
MAVLRRGRFSTGPAGAGEMLIRHAALVGAVHDAFPGLMTEEIMPERQAPVSAQPGQAAGGAARGAGEGCGSPAAAPSALPGSIPEPKAAA